MVTALREHRKAQMAEQAGAGKQGITWLNEWGLAFTGRYGLPTDRNAIRRDFHAMLRKAGLPYIRFHDLRHSCATLQLAAGVQPKVVQENLGHARVSTTLDLYAHVMPSTRREAADALASLLG
jgi:integrase